MYCCRLGGHVIRNVLESFRGGFDNPKRTLCSPTTDPVFLFTIFDSDSEKTFGFGHLLIWTNMSGCGVPKHQSCDDIINRGYKPWDWKSALLFGFRLATLNTALCSDTAVFMGDKHYHGRARGRQTKIASRLKDTDTSLWSWWRPKIEQKGEWLQMRDDAALYVLDVKTCQCCVFYGLFLLPPSGIKCYCNFKLLRRSWRNCQNLNILWFYFDDTVTKVGRGPHERYRAGERGDESAQSSFNTPTAEIKHAPFTFFPGPPLITWPATWTSRGSVP